MNVDEMQILLNQLLDEREIREVLYRYCHGIDRCDTEELLSVYHPGAVDDHGVMTGTAEEFVARAVPSIKESTESQSHFIGNITINLQGDVAHVESYFVSAAQLRVADGESPRLRRAGGRYVDRFERRSGAWKIAHRRVITDWNKVETFVPAYEPGDFPHGLRSKDDPSYVAYVSS